MKMQLPNAPPLYAQADQHLLRAAIAQADGQNQKTTDDVDLRSRGLYLYASDGSRWQIVVSTAGALSAVAA